MTKNQFKSLKVNDKLDVLFDNQVQTMDLIKGYKFWYNLYTVISGALVVGMGVLFKIIIFN